MAVITSSAVAMSIGGEVPSCPQSATLKMATELKDLQCSASNGWKRSAAGNKSWEMTLNFALTTDGALTLTDIHTAWDAAVVIAVVFAITGSLSVEGDGWITNVDVNAPENNDPVTVSVTITGDDELAVSA